MTVRPLATKYSICEGLQITQFTCQVARACPRSHGLGVHATVRAHLGARLGDCLLAKPVVIPAGENAWMLQLLLLLSRLTVSCARDFYPPSHRGIEQTQPITSVSSGERAAALRGTRGCAARTRSPRWHCACAGPSGAAWSTGASSAATL